MSEGKSYTIELISGLLHRELHRLRLAQIEPDHVRCMVSGYLAACPQWDAARQAEAEIIEAVLRRFAEDFR